MKEAKVYMSKLPKCCCDCPCYDADLMGCQAHNPNKTKEFPFNFDVTKKRPKDCPLIDIKTHDEEKDKKIKELENKIRELQEVDNKRAFRLYAVLYDVLEKQDPENVASRIDYLTGKDYSEMCELYKTAKNLKQHDRELVKEVCEKIKRNVRVTRIKKKWFAFEDDLRNILDQIQKEHEK